MDRGADAELGHGEQGVKVSAELDHCKAELIEKISVDTDALQQAASSGTA